MKHILGLLYSDPLSNFLAEKWDLSWKDVILSNTIYFRVKAIRHILTTIHHMWRVANGLDNTDLDGRNEQK